MREVEKFRRPINERERKRDQGVNSARDKAIGNKLCNHGNKILLCEGQTVNRKELPNAAKSDNNA